MFLFIPALLSMLAVFSAARQPNCLAKSLEIMHPLRPAGEQECEGDEEPCQSELDGRLEVFGEGNAIGASLAWRRMAKVTETPT